MQLLVKLLNFLVNEQLHCAALCIFIHHHGINYDGYNETVFLQYTFINKNQSFKYKLQFRNTPYV